MLMALLALSSIFTNVASLEIIEHTHSQWNLISSPSSVELSSNQIGATDAYYIIRFDTYANLQKGDQADLVLPESYPQNYFSSIIRSDYSSGEEVQIVFQGIKNPESSGVYGPFKLEIRRNFSVVSKYLILAQVQILEKLAQPCVDGEYVDEFGECQSCYYTCLRCSGPKPEDCLICQRDLDLQVVGKAILDQDLDRYIAYMRGQDFEKTPADEILMKYFSLLKKESYSESNPKLSIEKKGSSFITQLQELTPFESKPDSAKRQQDFNNKDLEEIASSEKMQIENNNDYDDYDDYDDSDDQYDNYDSYYKMMQRLKLASQLELKQNSKTTSSIKQEDCKLEKDYSEVLREQFAKTQYQIKPNVTGFCSCQSNQILTSDLKCVNCPENCALCGDYGECMICKTGFELNDDMLCSCGAGYVNIKGSCQQCMSGCKQCSDTDSSLCFECEEGLILDQFTRTCFAALF